jgi:hypothetical protein
LLFLVEYEAIQRDAKIIRTEDLSKYRRYINWTTILKDERIEWTDDLFELLIQDKISDGSLWINVVNHCPTDFLYTKLDNYKDFLSWMDLTNQLDIDFIIKNYVKYPWDTDVLIERASTSEIEYLLEHELLEKKYLDWSILTEKISDTFLERYINTIDFNLLFFTKKRKELCKDLILKHPKISWDWIEVSSNYDLSYLLSNIEIFAGNLNLEILVIRFLNADDDIFEVFKINPIVKKLLNDLLLKERSEFYIGGSQNIKLDLSRLIFLEQYNLIYWGTDEAAGVESNKNITWNFLTL